MKQTYFTVGPTQLYPTVTEHIKHAIQEDVFSLNHRGKSFGELFESSRTSLKKLLNIPKGFHVFFLGSATEGMERVIENCVAKNSFHIITGSFGKRFYQIALDLKKDAKKVELFDISTEKELEGKRRIRGVNDAISSLAIPRNAELIAITQSDTSTGVAIAEDAITKLKKQYPEKLMAVDVVSSLPYTNLNYKYFDLVLFSVQKGFGLPSGLGILVVSPQAYEKAGYLKKKGYAIGSFHSFLELQKYSEKLQTPETPNVFGIYLFEKVLRDFLKVGIDTIRKETDEKAQLMYEFFENHKDFSPFVKNPKDRAKTVLVIECKKGSKPVIEKLKQKGILVGSGYGDFKDSHIRIANFPSHSKKAVEKLLGAIEK